MDWFCSMDPGIPINLPPEAVVPRTAPEYADFCVPASAGLCPPPVPEDLSCPMTEFCSMIRARFWASSSSWRAFSQAALLACISSVRLSMAVDEMHSINSDSTISLIFMV